MNNNDYVKVRIIGCLVRNPTEWMNISEISRRTGISYSTVHKYVNGKKL